jgi:hypothetical protein
MAPELIALMRRVKQTFDPNNILNPGKIFPDAEVLTKKLDKMPGHSTQ